MKDYQSLSPRNGTASITWCSSRSTDGRGFSVRFGSTWAKYFVNWPSRRRAGLWEVT